MHLCHICSAYITKSGFTDNIMRLKGRNVNIVVLTSLIRFKVVKLAIIGQAV